MYRMCMTSEAMTATHVNVFCVCMHKSICSEIQGTDQ